MKLFPLPPLLRRGGVRGGGCHSEGADDGLDHPVDVVEDVIIPESENAITLSIEIGSSREVSRTVGVLTAVDFDHDSIGVTGKVREVRSDRCLPANVRRAKLQFSQLLPKLSFGIRGILTKTARPPNAPIN
jgi:hypothetical protein